MYSTVCRLGLQDFSLKAAAFTRIFYNQNIQNDSLLNIKFMAISGKYKEQIWSSN